MASPSGVAVPSTAHEDQAKEAVKAFLNSVLTLRQSSKINAIAWEKTAREKTGQEFRVTKKTSFISHPCLMFVSGRVNFAESCMLKSFG